jgi:hypothetical protein
MGFLSRALPVTYDYLKTTKEEIFSYIQKQEHLKERFVRLNLPEGPKLIKLPFDFAKTLESYAESLAKDYSEYQKVYGFRYQKQLQTLAKAIALLKNKDEVDEECIDDLKELTNFINFEFTKI